MDYWGLACIRKAVLSPIGQADLSLSLQEIARTVFWVVLAGAVFALAFARRAWRPLKFAAFFYPLIMLLLPSYGLSVGNGQALLW